jgi:hypothetical protein
MTFSFKFVGVKPLFQYRVPRGPKYQSLFFFFVLPINPEFVFVVMLASAGLKTADTAIGQNLAAIAFDSGQFVVNKLFLLPVG